MLTGATESRVIRVALINGALGVVCGFGLYASFLDIEGNQDKVLRIFAGLLATAVTSLYIERLKETITAGAEGKAAARGWVVGLQALCIALLFEFFNSAIETFGEFDAGGLARLGEHISGVPLLPGTAAYFGFLFLAGLWVVTGAVVSWKLVEATRRLGTSEPLPRRMGKGLVAGLGVGLVSAVLALAAYFVILQFVAMLLLLVFDPARWLAHIGDVSQHLTGVLKGWLMPLVWIGQVADHGAWGKIAAFVLLAVLVWSLVAMAEKQGHAVFILLLYGVVILLPLLFQAGAILAALFYGALVWAIPCAILGALTPLLSEPASEMRYWRTIAILAGVLLGYVTLVRLSSATWLLVLAAILIGVGLLAGRRPFGAELWPVYAFTVAILVGSTLSVGQASFAGVFEKVRQVTFLGNQTSRVPGVFVLGQGQSLEDQAERWPDEARSLHEGLTESLETYGKLTANDSSAEEAEDLAEIRDALHRLDELSARSRRLLEEANAVTEDARAKNRLLIQGGSGGGSQGASANAAGLVFTVGRLEVINKNHDEAERLVRPLLEQADAILPAAREKWPNLDAIVDRELNQRAQALEVALSSSIGFWITVALMFAWKARREQVA